MMHVHMHQKGIRVQQTAKQQYIICSHIVVVVVLQQSMKCCSPRVNVCSWYVLFLQLLLYIMKYDILCLIKIVYRYLAYA